jgi:hypothetical protein
MMILGFGASQDLVARSRVIIKGESNMGTYGNTLEECIAKIKTYKNSDPRCRYPFEVHPLGYCWSFALHVDNGHTPEKILKSCIYCELFTESKNFDKTWEGKK